MKSAKHFMIDAAYQVHDLLPLMQLGILDFHRRLSAFIGGYIGLGLIDMRSWRDRQAAAMRGCGDAIFSY